MTTTYVHVRCDKCPGCGSTEPKAMVFPGGREHQLLECAACGSRWPIPRRWDVDAPGALDTMRHWKVGDGVWYGTTLYDIKGIFMDEILLERHQPITFRLHPAAKPV